MWCEWLHSTMVAKTSATVNDMAAACSNHTG